MRRAVYYVRPRTVNVDARAWHAASANETLEAFGADTDRGLAPAEVARRRERHGENALPEAPRPGPLVRFLSQFRDPLVGALLVAAVVAAGVAHAEEAGQSFWLRYTDTLAILLIVVVNALLGFFQERRAEMALDALRNLAAPNARVLRDGRWETLAARELVPGDTVEVDTGDAVPADLRLVEDTDLSVEESSLTGESTPVDKGAGATLEPDTPLGDRATMVFSGTTVTRGRGLGVVVATGGGTEIGRIGVLVQSAQRAPTPLEERLGRFGRAILAICLALSALLFAIGLAQGDRSWELLLLTAVSLAVAAIPEGLPAITTITLALGTQRMAQRGAIVRKLPAVETLGSARVICTDKTGTLTENSMTVRRVETANGQYDVSGEGYEARGRITVPPLGGGAGARQVDEGEDAALDQLVLAGSIANAARLERDAKGHRRVVGDPTEAALLALGEKRGVHRREWLADRREVLREIPFDGDRKRMSVLVRDASGRVTAYVKGSPDTVVPLCTGRSAGDGIEALDAEARASLLRRNEVLASQAFRVLALASRADVPEGETDPERALTFLGYVAMQDPPRAEVADAVRETQEAGIRLVMITGDHVNTGVAIARELGFWHEGDLAVAGAELADMDDAALDDRVERVSVFARVSAEQKLRIVRSLRRRGLVAAMTGDGVNDAPALREAPIGVAMGRGGTDVARDAADMVLADDNFATIVAAVREGRAIFRNIQKFVFFLNSSNAGLVVAVIAGSFLPGIPHLTPLQLLWINLVTNGLPALALGVDPPDRRAMAEPPRPTSEPIVGRRELAGIVAVGTVMGLSALGMYGLPDAWPALFGAGTREAHLLEARTMAFAVLAIAPLFHALSCRSPLGSVLGMDLFSNRFLWGALASSLAVFLPTVLLPALHPVFRTTGLAGPQWAVVWAAAFLPLPFVEVLKAGGRRAVRNP